MKRTKEYIKLKKTIDDSMERNENDFNTDLIEEHSFWEAEELLSIGHYKVIDVNWFVSDM